MTVGVVSVNVKGCLYNEIQLEAVNAKARASATFSDDRATPVFAMTAVLLGWLLGLAQGVRHAFEPDHLAAVSTVVAEQRSARESARFAATWGIGHALVLFVVAGVLFVARREMPASLGNAFELVVAAMLVLLGVRALRQAIRAQRAVSHDHAPRAAHRHDVRRPLLIGVVHGLAGSGALTALVAGSFASATAGLAFMLLYGLGAAAGMAMLAGLAGVPLARVVRTRWGRAAIFGATGAFSLVLGFVWGWPIVSAFAAVH
jgi:high-affinity nickel-transport protein